MKIPNGVNKADFINEAKKKGIKIESKYEHVFLLSNNRKPIRHYWAVKVGGKMKTFELTDNGELEAFEYHKNNFKSNRITKQD